jgi:hypothetical protein
VFPHISCPAGAWERGTSNTSGGEEEVPARSEEALTTVGLARPNSKITLLMTYYCKFTTFYSTVNDKCQFLNVTFAFVKARYWNLPIYQWTPHIQNSNQSSTSNKMSWLAMCIRWFVRLRITKLYRIYVYLCSMKSVKSVKFWRENPANEHSMSSGKFWPQMQKIREIRSSQFIVDCIITTTNLTCLLSVYLRYKNKALQIVYTAMGLSRVDV